MAGDRYRLEGDTAFVDVRLAGIERLFDNRDPAPFRERDLDPDLVEYLIAAVEDLAARDRVQLVFWLEKPGAGAGEIEAACRAHFAYELDRLERRRRRQRRTGWIALLLAVISITALLAVAQFVDRLVQGSLGAGLKEGLVISCWVMMWKPVEILIYDWIPWWRQRAILRALVAMPIEVRHGVS